MTLHQLIERYITFRQTLGERFVTNASILRAFGRFFGMRARPADVRPKRVAAFLRGDGPLTSGWHVRASALRGLYRYAVPRGYVSRSPLPASTPRRPPPFVPHIYSHDELRRLLDATADTRHPLRRMTPVTLRTVLLLLYGAGLRVGEARRLTVADVDLAARVLAIRESKFGKSRLVPIGPQLTAALERYAAGRPRRAARDPRSPFFTGTDGAGLSRPGLDLAFRLARTRSGIRRTDGARYQPRMHDLRHTFAVHRLTEWYRQGKDVQSLLPLLSVYLGHRRLAHTQVYLTATPDLLLQAGTRFERYVGAEEERDA